MICKVENIEGLTARAIEDSKDTAHQKGGSTHKHKGELHCRIFLVSRTPITNEKVHGDERDFIEHEHHEQVNRHKESEHSKRKKREPKEVFLGERFETPRSKCSGKHNDGRQQKHCHRNAVNTNSVVYMKRGKPSIVHGKEHILGCACVACIEIHHHKSDRTYKQCACSCNHNTPHSIHSLGKPKEKKHQKRYYYK